MIDFRCKAAALLSRNRSHMELPNSVRDGSKRAWIPGRCPLAILSRLRILDQSLQTTLLPESAGARSFRVIRGHGFHGVNAPPALCQHQGYFAETVACCAPSIYAM